MIPVTLANLSTRPGSAPRRGRSRSGVVLALTLGLGIALTWASTARSAANEIRLQAAFLYNFAKYVDWPDSSFADASAPIRFCVVGDHEVGEALSGAVEGKSLKGRPLESVALASGSPPDTVADCHVAYLSASGGDASLAAFARALADAPVFTVSDAEDFARAGGVANFRREGTKLKIDINVEAARSRGLDVGAQLLRVANPVD